MISEITIEYTIAGSTKTHIARGIVTHKKPFRAYSNKTIDKICKNILDENGADEITEYHLGHCYPI